MNNVNGASSGFVWSDVIQACHAEAGHYRSRGSERDQHTAGVFDRLATVFEAMQPGIYRRSETVANVAGALETLGVYVKEPVAPSPYVYSSPTSADALLGPRSGYGGHTA